MTKAKRALLLPGKTRNLEGAELNPAACLAAIDFLEIDRPVEIKWSAGLRRAGAYRYRDGKHVITASTYSDAARLGQTIWHELIHAAQAERDDRPTNFLVAYDAENRLRGYQANRFEVEARTDAAYLAAEMELAS